MDWYTAAGQYTMHIIPEPIASRCSNVSRTLKTCFPSLVDAALGFWPTGQPTATQTVAWINQNFAFGDWTFHQQFLTMLMYLDSDQPSWENFFFQPQYGAFNAWSTVGKSNYHGASLSIRQRLGNSVILDFNYTFSKSLDDASGLQNAGSFSARHLF